MSGKGNRGRSHGNRGRGQGPRRGGPNRGQGNRTQVNRAQGTQGSRFAFAHTATTSAEENGWTPVVRSTGQNRTQGNRGRGRGQGPRRGGPSRNAYPRTVSAVVEPTLNMGQAAKSVPSYMANMPTTGPMPGLPRIPTFNEMQSGKLSWANLTYGELRPRNVYTAAPSSGKVNMPVSAMAMPNVSSSAAAANVVVPANNGPSVANNVVPANNGPSEGKRVVRDGVEYITSATATYLNTSENAGALKEWRVIKGDQTIPERNIVYTREGNKFFYTKRPVFGLSPEGERIVYEGIWLPYIYIDTIPYTFESFNEMMAEQEKFSKKQKEVYDERLLQRWGKATTEEEKRAIYEQREAKRKANQGDKYKPTKFEDDPFSDVCVQTTRVTKDGSEPTCYYHQYQMVIRRLFDFIDEDKFLRSQIRALEASPEGNEELLERYHNQLNYVSRQINALDQWESEILNHVRDTEILRLTEKAKRKAEAEKKGKARKAENENENTVENIMSMSQENFSRRMKDCYARHPGQEDVCLSETDPGIRGNIRMYPSAANFPMPTGPVFMRKPKGGKRKTRKARKGKKGTRKH